MFICILRTDQATREAIVNVKLLNYKMSIEPFERLINVFKIKTSIDYSVDVEEIEKLDVRHSEILPQNDPAVEDHENTINNL